ncbi:hypothetical protein DV515_00014022 [Chloebia gouldiae]|uniref:Uncharacterized protein n=1 Tax=Chloebia gouldiae TaxID=44316 RepID=A0A3L8RZC6_CHLGU|nr:hypothetical protein DV515_00014022 [Chloebia gouldiae]
MRIRLRPAGRTLRGEDTPEAGTALGISGSPLSGADCSIASHSPSCRARHDSSIAARSPGSTCWKPLALAAEEGLRVPVNLPPASGNPLLPSSAGLDAAGSFQRSRTWAGADPGSPGALLRGGGSVAVLREDPHPRGQAERLLRASRTWARCHGHWEPACLPRRATSTPCHQPTVPPAHRATSTPWHQPTMPPAHRATSTPCHQHTTPPCSSLCSSSPARVNSPIAGGTFSPDCPLRSPLSVRPAQPLPACSRIVHHLDRGQIATSSGRIQGKTPATRSLPCSASSQGPGEWGAAGEGRAGEWAALSPLPGTRQPLPELCAAQKSSGRFFPLQSSRAERS